MIAISKKLMKPIEEISTTLMHALDIGNVDANAQYYEQEIAKINTTISEIEMAPATDPLNNPFAVT